MPLKNLLQTLNRLLGWPTKYLFGDDIFISYSRADGVTYAAGLAGKLTERGFTCRFDLWGTDPGEKMPRVLKRSLARSASLVLIGTPGAAASTHVREEIARMKRRGRRIVPVLFDGVSLGNRVVTGGAIVDTNALMAREEAATLKFTTALWAADISGLPLSTEESNKLRTGEPTGEIVNRIEKNLTFKRKDDRLRFATRLVAVVLMVLIAAALATSYEAYAMVRLAQAKSEEARVKTEEANIATLKATTAEAKANEQEQKAQDAKLVADQQTTIARTAKAEAVIAKTEAEQQTKIAEAQRREAARQGDIAWSRNRLAQAERERLAGDDPFRVPLKLAVDAYRKYPSSEADALLRYGIEGVPHSVSCAKTDKYIQTLAYGPDSKTIYALAAENVYEFNAGDGAAMETYKFSEEEPIESSISADGQTVAAAFKVAPNRSRIDVFDTGARGSKAPSISVAGLVEKLIVSKDGRYIAALSSDHFARVWLVGKTEPVVNEEDSARGFRELILSNDGSYAAAVSENPTNRAEPVLRIWNTKTDERPVTIQRNFCGVAPDEGSTCIVGLTFSSWGLLAFTTSEAVYFFNPASKLDPNSTSDPNSSCGANVLRPTGGALTMMSFYGPQNYAAIGSANGLVRLYAPGGNGPWLEVAQLRHTTAVTHFTDVSLPDGRFFFLSVTADYAAKGEGHNTVHLWKVRWNGVALATDEVARLPHDAALNSILAAPFKAGVQLVTASGDSVRLWQKSLGSSLTPLSYTAYNGLQAHISANRRHIAVSATAGSATEAWTLNTTGNAEPQPIVAERGQSVAVSSDGLRVLTYSSDSSQDTNTASLRLYDLKAKRDLLSQSGYGVLAFSPDLEFMAVRDATDHVAIWKASNGPRDYVRLGEGAIVKFSPDSRHFAVVRKASNGNASEVEIWDTGDPRKGSRPQVVAPLQHPSSIVTFMYSGKGNYLITKSGQAAAYKLKLWTAMGKEIKGFKYEDEGLPDQFAFSPDDRYLGVAGDDGSVQVHNTSDGKLFTRLKEQMNVSRLRMKVSELVFTSDGRYLALGVSEGGSSDVRAVTVWKVGVPYSEEPVTRLDFGEAVRQFSFSEYDRYLITITDRNTQLSTWRTKDLLATAEYQLAPGAGCEDSGQIRSVR